MGSWKSDGVGMADGYLQGIGGESCENGIDLWLREEIQAKIVRIVPLSCQSYDSMAHKFCGIIYPTKGDNKLELREM